jgi:hypothetical protein
MQRVGLNRAVNEVIENVLLRHKERSYTENDKNVMMNGTNEQGL